MRFIRWLDSLIARFMSSFYPDLPLPSNTITVSNMPNVSTTTVPSQAPVSPVVPDLDWSTQKVAYHAVRVMCDQAGLSLEEKNLICSCIYQESRFLNTAINHNKNAQGVVTSTDYGICQINDWFHIGPGKDFPSVEYVVGNPDKCVAYMISCYEHGLLRLWSSYVSGAYKQWLNADSPMWALSRV